MLVGTISDPLIRNKEPNNQQVLFFLFNGGKHHTPPCLFNYVISQYLMLLTNSQIHHILTLVTTLFSSKIL